MRAYERFVEYAKIHTTASETSGTHPSFEGERELSMLLYKELQELGAVDLELDEYSYVYGRLPATEGCENAMSLGFVAHVDTSPESSGENVCPVLHENYDGEDVHFPAADKTMSVEEYPHLLDFKGECLITSDGTTLLGADDKAGVAEIMTALWQIKDIPHGEIWVCFTPDEEIGEGTDYINLEKFRPRFAYTLDGGDCNEIEYENFNAASAEVSIKGFSTHTGDAYGKMINASKLAIEFDSMIPGQESPEKTRGYEGFYHLHTMEGTVEQAKLSYLIRDHDYDKYLKRCEFIKSLETVMNDKYGEGTVSVTVKETYLNMAKHIAPEKHLIENARIAIEKIGLNPVEVPIRGGTDGARLSYMGIPTPNLGTGGYNYHGVFECITAERMDRMVQIIMNIVELYR